MPAVAPHGRGREHLADPVWPDTHRLSARGLRDAVNAPASQVGHEDLVRLDSSSISVPSHHPPGRPGRLRPRTPPSARAMRICVEPCSKRAASLGTSSPRMTSWRSSTISAAVAVPRARVAMEEAYRVACPSWVSCAGPSDSQGHSRPPKAARARREEVRRPVSAGGTPALRRFRDTFASLQDLRQLTKLRQLGGTSHPPLPGAQQRCSL